MISYWLTAAASLIHLYDCLITELQLILRLYQTHPECPHVQQSLLDVHSLRAFSLGLEQAGVDKNEGA